MGHMKELAIEQANKEHEELEERLSEYHDDLCGNELRETEVYLRDQVRRHFVNKKRKELFNEDFPEGAHYTLTLMELTRIAEFLLKIENYDRTDRELKKFIEGREEFLGQSQKGESDEEMS